MRKIEFQDKTNQTAVTDRPKQITSEDINEIKEVVNENADDLNNVSKLPSEITSGWIRTNGTLELNATRQKVEYKVDPRSKVMILIHQESDPIGTAASLISAWNGDVFVSNIKTSTGANDYKEYIEVPNDVDRIILSIDNSIGSYGYSIYVTSPEVSQKLNEITENERRIAYNNFIPSSILDGYYLRNNGVITASATRHMLRYDVEEAEKYNITIHQSEYSNELGSSGIILSTWNNDNLVDMAVTAIDGKKDYQLPFIVPNGVNNIRISMANNPGGYVDVKGSSYLIEKNTSEISEIRNELLESAIIVDSFVRTNGVVDVGDNRQCLKYSVSKNDILSIKIRQASNPLGSGGSVLSIWNEGVFVRNIKTGVDGELNYDLNYTIPEIGVDEIRISMSSEIGSTVNVYKEITSNTFRDYFDKYNYKPQIFNGYLPKKEASETLEILLLGSSWGVDTIAGLAELCGNLGVNVNTGNVYKSSGSPQMYLDDLDSGSTNTFYYNKSDGTKTTQSLTIPQVIAFKNWDIIVLQNSADTSMERLNGKDPHFESWLSYMKLNATNPRVIFALNSTWYNKGFPERQIDSYNVTNDLIKQLGIDLLIPCGAALEYLRKTSVNDVNDLFRDGWHVNVGVGRFTNVAAFYHAVVYPIFGVALDGCTFTGAFDYNGSIVETYPRINVDATNRAICIDAGKKANSRRFYKR